MERALAGRGRADALADDARAHGATFLTGVEVASLADLPPARAILFDTTPRAMVRIAGDRLPVTHIRRLLRFRHGDAAAKVDYALAGPVPWAAEGLAAAGTIHLGGTREEMAASEAAGPCGRPLAGAGRERDVPLLRLDAARPGRARSERLEGRHLRAAPRVRDHAGAVPRPTPGVNTGGGRESPARQSITPSASRPWTSTKPSDS